MSEELLNKIRRILVYLAFLMAAFVLSYFLAYPLGYAPNGYEVLEKKENSVLVESHNAWGLEEERITFQPPENDEWQMSALVDRINDQNIEYHLFFTSLMVTIFWVGMDVLKGKSLYRVLVFSCLYVFVSGLSLFRHLNDIQKILEGTHYL